MSPEDPERGQAEKDLCRLGVVGITESPGLPPPAGAHDFLLAVESLSLTLDDARLRARSLSALALVRLERGERERALELAAMARRTGEARVEVAALLGTKDEAQRFARFSDAVSKDARGVERLREVPGWVKALAHAGVAIELGFLEELGERLRALVLFENAKLLASAAPRALELMRGLLGSDSPLVVCAAVEGLARASALSPEEALAARGRLVRSSLPTAALDALVSIGRVVPLEEPDTGDLRADAVVRLAQVRRAGEERDLARGRDLLHKVQRLVTELRVKHRRAEATHVFFHLLPLLAAFHPEDGVPLLEGLAEDPIVAWAPPAASDVLAAFSVATTKLADSRAAFALLELDARLALRRIRHGDSEKKERALFHGLGWVARAAPGLGDPRALAGRIADGARESLLARQRDPSPEYHALLGCGEALARAGDHAALEGAIDAVGGKASGPLPPLLDEALRAANAVDSVDQRLRVLELARTRLDEAPVARWLSDVALRAGELVGPAAALERWRHAEERREHARLSAFLMPTSRRPGSS